MTFGILTWDSGLETTLDTFTDSVDGLTNMDFWMVSELTSFRRPETKTGNYNNL